MPTIKISPNHLSNSSAWPEACNAMHFRDAGGGEGSGPWYQFLADQLTLFQPAGADYDQHITTDPPPDFWSVRRLCIFFIPRPFS